jgi:C4-type Zn-finger protein
MAFECPHCGFKNNELQSAGTFNERGHTITLTVNNKEVKKKKKDNRGVMRTKGLK